MYRNTAAAGQTPVFAAYVLAKNSSGVDFVLPDRRFDLGEHWALPGANEPGNLAGFPACALAASWVVDGG